jgi:hypothetical protein
MHSADRSAVCFAGSFAEGVPKKFSWKINGIRKTPPGKDRRTENSTRQDLPNKRLH